MAAYKQTHSQNQNARYIILSNNISADTVSVNVTEIKLNK